MKAFIVGVIVGMGLMGLTAWAQQGWGTSPMDTLNQQQQYQTNQQIQQYLQQQQFQQPMMPYGRNPC